MYSLTLLKIYNLEQFIKEAIPDATVEIEDLKGDGDHYSATVTSKSLNNGITALMKFALNFNIDQIIELNLMSYKK